MITLTYPKTFPTDGRAVKKHMNALRERMRRMNWFTEHSLVWFIEFQDRGAPHIHLFSTGWVSKGWIANSWADITGGNPEACSRVETLRHARAAGEYARKYACKKEQKDVPHDFVSIGRMWGCWGPKFFEGLPRVPVVVASTKSGTPSDHWRKIRACETCFGVRMVETFSGWVLYGEPNQIGASWRYLQALIAQRDPIEVSRDDSSREMQLESFDM